MEDDFKSRAGGHKPVTLSQHSARFLQYAECQALAFLILAEFKEFVEKTWSSNCQHCLLPLIYSGWKDDPDRKMLQSGLLEDTGQQELPKVPLLTMCITLRLFHVCFTLLLVWWLSNFFSNSIHSKKVILHAIQHTQMCVAQNST